MNEEQHKIELTKILGLSGDSLTREKRDTASWAEIYVEIGRLQERANKVNYYPPMFVTGTQPLTNPAPTVNPIYTTC